MGIGTFLVIGCPLSPLSCGLGEVTLESGNLFSISWMFPSNVMTPKWWIIWNVDPRILTQDIRTDLTVETHLTVENYHRLAMTTTRILSLTNNMLSYIYMLSYTYLKTVLTCSSLHLWRPLFCFITHDHVIIKGFNFIYWSILAKIRIKHKMSDAPRYCP